MVKPSTKKKRRLKMIKIYLSPSCSSCRKVKAWFEEQEIPFKEINILKTPLTEENLKEMLNKSLDGTDEIVSTRSKVFKEQNIDVDSMSVSELLKFITENPSILKRPIIVDEDKIQVGYNADEIEIFERRKKEILAAKRIAASMCTKENCPQYDTCDHRFTDTKKTVSLERLKECKR
jgi:regulatory protein spx